MLSRYNAWANNKVFEAVAALPAGEASRERPSLFRSMVATLNHVHAVDLIWQAQLGAASHQIKALDTVIYPDLDALRRAQQALDDWYVSWAELLTEEMAEKLVHFTLIGGNTGEMRCSDIAVHRANHTSYHRGFVADMFYQVPARPPTVDLPVYMREVAAAHDR
jgi:uncharacterized damage-inducible protein DinB